MTKEQSFISADRIDPDRFISSQTRERTLNEGVVQADISDSFEEYLEIFDVFYDEDVEVTSDTGEKPIRGKARVRSLLANFLVPSCNGRSRWSIDIRSTKRDSWRRNKSVGRVFKEPTKTTKTVWPWWWWVIVILFPIPFSPWWLGIVCSVAFILLIVLLKPNSK